VTTGQRVQLAGMFQLDDCLPMNAAKVFEIESLFQSFR
jgi:hypothetical protein